MVVWAKEMTLGVLDDGVASCECFVSLVLSKAPVPLEATHLGRAASWTTILERAFHPRRCVMRLGRRASDHCKPPQYAIDDPENFDVPMYIQSQVRSSDRLRSGKTQFLDIEALL